MVINTQELRLLIENIQILIIQSLTYLRIASTFPVKFLIVMLPISLSDALFPIGQNTHLPDLSD